jgi:hypothetical protein
VKSCVFRGATAQHGPREKKDTQTKTVGDQAYSRIIKFGTFTLLLFINFTVNLSYNSSRDSRSKDHLAKKITPVLDHAAMTQMIKTHALFLALIYVTMGSVQVRCCSGRGWPRGDLSCGLSLPQGPRLGPSSSGPVAVLPPNTHTSPAGLRSSSPPKQACCKDGDAELQMLESDTALSSAVFGGAGLPLSPIPGCLKKIPEYVYRARTRPGDCNAFGCSCDFCYGARKRGVCILRVYVC